MKVDAIRAELTSHLNRSYARGSAEFEQLLQLLAAHPTWGCRMAEINGLRIRRSRLNKAIQLQLRTRRAWFTVSWRQCATRCRAPREGCQSSHTRHLVSAMRTAIRYQCRRWRRTQRDFSCAACGQKNGLQVDHKQPSFHALQTAFLEQQRSPPPMEFGVERSSCARKFLPRDAYFKRKWQDFHAKRATYQLLCKCCNIAKSST